MPDMYREISVEDTLGVNTVRLLSSCLVAVPTSEALSVLKRPSPRPQILLLNTPLFSLLFDLTSYSSVRSHSCFYSTLPMPLLSLLVLLLYQPYIAQALRARTPLRYLMMLSTVPSVSHSFLIYRPTFFLHH
ncbi:hypothetical protein K469DRAFT_268602 [Zopfia rhizophila CBS 207.26]|uniref:Uncharacterized protein n=1 Tax=Zopfia rhizophila CBS 207.26 TaxID=1314779 RepID=A0A6A6DME0_9PEZI|nr:hypothetical protein K469DRAFT_268602 [Zopfia rhizophila CBS 207.26]